MVQIIEYYEPMSNVAFTLQDIGKLIDQKLQPIKDEMVSVKDKLGIVKDELGVVKVELRFVKDEMGVVKDELSLVKLDVNSIHKENNSIRDELREVKQDVSLVKIVVEREFKQARSDLTRIEGKVDLLNTQFGALIAEYEPRFKRIEDHVGLEAP